MIKKTRLASLAGEGSGPSYTTLSSIVHKDFYRAKKELLNSSFFVCIYCNDQVFYFPNCLFEFLF